MIKIKEGMPVEEYKRRIDALESAKASSALEGFVLHPEDEAIIERYLSDEISEGECINLLIKKL